MVMFDLPVVTQQQRHWATKYRQYLLDAGFSRVQLSVYAKYFTNASGLRPLIPELRRRIPADGEVRVLRLTDEQWAHTYRYFGPREAKPMESIPEQLGLIFDNEEENLPGPSA